MPAYFVTATGTDIGKTYVGCALLRAWKARGYKVMATKPVMTGFAEKELAASDCGRLLASMDQTCTSEAVSEMCHTRLAPPLAPNVAMRQAGIAVGFGNILQLTQDRLKSRTDAHLVEGAGGVMSPVTDDSLQMDLITQLSLPVVLVTSPYLGSVSHTLSAVDMLRSQNAEIAKVIVTETVAGKTDVFEFAREILRFRDIPLSWVRHGGSAKELAAELAL